MAYPNPELYSDWQSWAKAVSAYEDRKQEDENRELEEGVLIDTFHQDWTQLGENPLKIYKYPNNVCFILGQIQSTTSSSLGQMFTIPIGCRLRVQVGLAQRPIWVVGKNGATLSHDIVFCDNSGIVYQGFACAILETITFSIAYLTRE